MRKQTMTVAALTLVLLIANMGCGGGGSSSPSSPPPSTQGVSIAVSPASAIVPAGSVHQFTATVSNTTNTAVTWQVNGITGGNAVLGTISSSGVYTAPLAPPAAGRVTVRAISQADSTKSATATVTPVYSTASLTGSYVFKAVVTDSSGFQFAAGVFNADGRGNVTSGIEDVNDSTYGPSTNVPFSGSYSMGADGRGTATVTSALSTSSFKFVMVSSTNAQLIEFDNSAVTSGFVLAQDQSAIGDVAGTFVFAFQGQDIGTTTSGPLSSVGQVTFSGSGTASGTQDTNDIGTFSANVPFAGTYTIGGQGRGTATMTSSYGTSNYAFYIVNAKTIEFLNIDSSGLMESGDILAQDSTAFSNASLTSSAFLVSGQGTAAGETLVASGRFDTDGAGTLQNGLLDENDGGTFYDGIPFSGTYSIASNGRGTASVTTSNGTSTFVLWMWTAGKAQFMESDSSAAGSGLTLAQQKLPFSTASMKGNFAFTLAGAAGSSPLAATGQAVLNGAGSLSGNEDINVGGTTASGVALTGTYSLGSNGSGTASVSSNSGTTPIRIDLVSPSEAVFISADPTQPLIGFAEQQCSDCH